MSTEHHTIFPFDEIHRPDSSLFATAEEAQRAGYELNQIWSVIGCYDNLAYGPPHCRECVVGYIATQETHDGDTYYYEPDDDFEIELDEDEREVGMYSLINDK